MGKSVLSGSAIIYDALERSRDDAEIKILHAGMRNPYLSERIALNRESLYREWREDIQYATTVGRRLQSHLKPRLELREHSEGYVWRLFIFDDKAYVQPYLHPSDNARRAPVLRFDRNQQNNGEGNSLYAMFDAYFDLKWEECAPTPTRLDDMVGAGDATAVAALVQRSGTWVFVIPRRFMELEGDELPFHSIGGKRKPGETWVEALQREAREEVGSGLEIQSCVQTRDITTSAEFEPLQLIDDPQPYCVYKRTKTVDPEVLEPEVLWIVGFEATLPGTARIAPRSEIAAIVHLSPEMLRRTARERITYGQIRRARDGSGIQVGQGIDFDDGRVAVPAGLAALPTMGASSPAGG
jgi:8-oxo-dGTP pyrophosphatase MutT (NUDIX family)